MLNRIVIMGRLTRDPELRRTQNGTVSQMNAVKEAQRHGALPLQRLFYCDKFRHASDLSF